MATAKPTTVYSHVTKDPAVCGGKACIDITSTPRRSSEVLAGESDRPLELFEGGPWDCEKTATLTL